MARSEKARELAQKQRAQVKAEKERKKNSSDPRDWGAARQLRETYKMTVEYDKAAPWLVWGLSILTLIVVLLLFSWLTSWWWGILPGVLTAVAVGMWVLIWRAKKAAYQRATGQMGTTQLGLSELPKKWTVSDPIAANRSMDMVFRAVGPGGIVLVGEGEPGRLKNLLATEKKKHEQVAYGVSVMTYQVGDKPGQIPTNQIAGTIKKLPKVMTQSDIDTVKNRLKALDAMRVKPPIPQGPLPTKGARQAMRGR